MPGSINHVSVFFVKRALSLDEVILEGSYKFLTCEELDHPFAVSEVSLKFALKVQPVVVDVIEIHVVDVFA